MYDMQGMCVPVSDRDYFNLMTTDKNGRNDALVTLILKYYPALAIYA